MKIKYRVRIKHKQTDSTAHTKTPRDTLTDAFDVGDTRW